MRNKRNISKKKRTQRHAEYKPRHTKRELAQMEICLNCPYPKSWCDGEPSHCARRAAQEEQRKQANES